MISFIDRVRQSMVTHPVQRGFSLSQWEKQFNEHDNHDEPDKMLYEIGKWVFDRLEEIRCKLRELPLGNIPAQGFSRYICGALNLAAKGLSLKRVTFQAEGIVVSEALIQAKLPANEVRAAASLDEILIQTIDGGRYPLIHSLSTTANERKKTKSEVDLAIIQLLIHLGQYYDIVEGIWGNALWHGLQMVHTDSAIIFAPRDVHYSMNRAVSIFRRETLNNQIAQYAVQFWNSTPLSKREAYVHSVPKVRVVGAGRARRLHIYHRAKELKRAPLSLILRMIWQDEYLGPLITQSLPKHPELCVEDLLRAWETLRSLAEETLDRYPPPKERLLGFGEILPYATAYQEKDISALLQRALGINSRKAELIVSLLKFDANPRCELWSHPLVETLRGQLTLVVAPLLYGNIIRCVERWMKNGGLAIESKGPAFEKEVRRYVSDTGQDSPIKEAVYVHPDAFSINVGKETEEIDLIFVVGERIIIGEIKCQMFPTEALEYFEYYTTLNEAAIQAKRKANFVRHHLDVVLPRLQIPYSLPVGEAVVMPCVVPNQPLGVGFPIEGVPVVDLPIILRYLEGKWEQFVIFDPDGKKRHVGKTTYLYRNQKEASSGLPDYLLNPPQIQFFKQFAKVRELPMPPLNTGEPVVLTLTTEVRLPLGEAEFKTTEEPIQRNL